MSQYIIDRWGAENGLSGAPVYAIVQTNDGYLWIGTESGLIRFDGLTFRRMETTDAAKALLDQVLGLIVDGKGDLWVRVRSLRHLRFRADNYFDVDTEAGPQDDRATATILSSGKSRELIFATVSSGLLHGESLQTLVPNSALPISPVLSMAGSTEDLWLGTRDIGLLRVLAGKVTAIRQGLPGLKINCLLKMDSGDVWVGTDNGVVRWNGTSITKDGVPPSLIRAKALAMIRDRDENIWIGTSNGLLRINAKGAATLPAAPNQAVTALFEDREGDIWAGSANGIERIRDTAFATYSSGEGLPSETNGPVYAGSSDRIWFAPENGGLYSLRDGKVVSIPGLEKDVVYSIAGDNEDVWVGRQRGGLTHIFPDGSSKTFTTAGGLAQDSVTAVTVGRDGTVWAGTVSKGVSSFHEGHFTTRTTADGLPANTISSILETSDGTVWFATPNGLSNNRGRTLLVSDGLPSENVNCLFEDSAHTLWIGTLAGLAILRSGRVQVPPGADLPREQIFGIAEDKSGSMWFTTSSHVVRLKGNRVRMFELADGLRSLSGVKRSRSVVADGSGRIWLSTSRGLSVVDPARLAARAVPAIVQIQALSADANPITMGSEVRVPPGHQRITLDFWGLSLALPDRTRFRYTLDGFDHGWSKPISSRQAIYTNLGPGPYRFHVMASNVDGDFDSPGATLSFRIEPSFWQTWWFVFATFVVATALVIVAVRSRTARLTRQMNLRFETQLAERTRIARELHDTLLQSFHGLMLRLQVVDDLLPEGKAKEQLQQSLRRADQAIAEGRNVVFDLRASATVSNDLAQAVTALGDELASQDSAAFRMVVEGQARDLHPIIRDELYRIAHEALRNAFRHARAGHIEVEITYADRSLHLRVRDDGAGIPSAVLEEGRPGHYGLAGIRERAKQINAKLDIWSGPGRGTEIALNIAGSVAYRSSASHSWLRLFPGKKDVA
jgi:signal transduction histidine kinase